MKTSVMGAVHRKNNSTNWLILSFLDEGWTNIWTMNIYWLETTFEIEVVLMYWSSWIANHFVLDCQLQCLSIFLIFFCSALHFPLLESWSIIYWEREKKISKSLNEPDCFWNTFFNIIFLLLLCQNLQKIRTLSFTTLNGCFAFRNCLIGKLLVLC